MRPVLRKSVAFAALLLTALPAWAANYEVLDERLDASRRGYTVVRVWGTHREMGRAIGEAFAQDLVAGMPGLRALARDWNGVRAAVAESRWPAELEEEIAGMVEGIEAARPGAGIDALDLKALNTFGDWAYVNGCRSHSAWGSFVRPPVKTLSTRRLDFDTPFSMALHHVVYAFEPSDGSAGWINVAWPGYVTAITGVNEAGTLVSIHDDPRPVFVARPGTTLRSVAARELLSGTAGLPLDEQREAAQRILAGRTVATGAYLNLYAPEGRAAVFTCASGGSCDPMRVPQPAYLGGEVILTTNRDTDGTRAPADDTFLDAYYRAGASKQLADHFALMGTSGLHLVSVAYRGRGDMTIWMNGRGRSDRLELEWADLFSRVPAETPEDPAVEPEEPADPPDDPVVQPEDPADPPGEPGEPDDGVTPPAPEPTEPEVDVPTSPDLGEKPTDASHGAPQEPPAATVEEQGDLASGCSAGSGVAAPGAALLALALLARRRRGAGR